MKLAYHGHERGSTVRTEANAHSRSAARANSRACVVDVPYAVAWRVCREGLRHTVPMEWEPEAKARLQKAPFFVRPFVKGCAEKEAKARGLESVTSALLDELKAREHKG